MALRLTTYYKGEQIPELPGNNVFHSKELFLIYEATSGYEPFLLVGHIDNKPVAKLLAVIRKSKRTFPPSFTRRCVVYGNGEYMDDSINKENVFGEMLAHLTKEALRKAFLIEFRNLDNALFGYKYFRSNHYFPINWLRVRNSLHSLQQPMQRFSVSRRRQIKKGVQNGAEIAEAKTEEEISSFAKMLRKNYSSHIRKHFPDPNFFHVIIRDKRLSNLAKVFIVKYKNKIIGGSVCLFSGTDAYLLFSGGMRTTYAKQYPGVLAVWKAIEYTYQHGYAHLEFMDAGLPFKEYGYRNFILRFGGKQSSTRRWFRFQWSFLNKISEKIYV